MGRKYSRELNKRKPKKRKFYGNRYTREHDTTFASTSAEKLSSTQDKEIIIDPAHGYRIVAFLSVFTAISELVICKECKEQVRFGESSVHGLGFKIAVQCKCDTRYINSCPLIDNKSYEVNRRLVYVMKLLGIGREGLNLFCGLMDLSQGISNTLYYSAMENIYHGAKAVFDMLTKKAAEEEKIINTEHGNPMTEITVYGNGTWKKRGFGSLFGITTLIGKYTSKVIDLVVQSAYCDVCKLWESKRGTEEYNIWINEHMNECTANYNVSAEKMEVDSVKEMFRRSGERFQVKYSKYVGNGETKILKALFDDSDSQVIAKEYMEHAEKRMSSRLRDVKKTQKLGVKNMLTDKLIKKLTTFYGLAIRTHLDSVDNMRSAVWAIFYHKISTNENPQHMYCPVGPESWCEWRVAEAKCSLDGFNHEPPLEESVKNAIKPIYEELSSRELLETYLGGVIQCYNESLNSTIWKFVPEHLRCRTKGIEIAAYLAASIFNEGFYAVLKIMTTIGIIIGVQTKVFSNGRDESRLQRLTRRHFNDTRKFQHNDFYEDEEAIL